MSFPHTHKRSDGFQTEHVGRLPPEFMIRTPCPSPGPPSSPVIAIDRPESPDVNFSHLSTPSGVRKRHAYFDQDPSCALSLPSVKRQKRVETSAFDRIPMPIQRQLNGLAAQLSSAASLAASPGRDQMSPTEHAASVYRLCLETIPFINVVNEINLMCRLLFIVTTVFLCSVS